MKTISKALVSCLVALAASVLLAASGAADGHEGSTAAEEASGAAEASAGEAAEDVEGQADEAADGYAVDEYSDQGYATEEPEEEMSDVDPGVYIEVSGGASRSLDQDFTYAVPVGSRGGDVDFKVGYLYGGAIGLRVNQVRFELASQFRTQDVESFTFGGVRQTTGGEIDVITGMANFYYDFDLGWPVRPYIGGGLGIARLTMDVEGRGQPLGSPPAIVVDDTENEIAYNGMLGMSMAIAPGTELFLNYRFLGILDETSFDASQPGVNQGDFEMDFTTNEYTMGLRYTF